MTEEELDAAVDVIAAVDAGSAAVAESEDQSEERRGNSRSAEDYREATNAALPEH